MEKKSQLERQLENCSIQLEQLLRRHEEFEKEEKDSMQVIYRNVLQMRQELQMMKNDTVTEQKHRPIVAEQVKEGLKRAAYSEVRQELLQDMDPVAQAVVEGAGQLVHNAFTQDGEKESLSHTEVRTEQYTEGFANTVNGENVDQEHIVNSVQRPEVDQENLMHSGERQQAALGDMQVFEPQERKKKDTMEIMFGKSMMGIFASILVLIGLSIFAIGVLPILPDSLKVACMFLFSFAMIGIGMYKQKQEGANRVFLSITACGLGAVYLSLLFSKIYFQLFPDFLLYLLLLGWTGLVFYLSREHSRVFYFIGQVGIVFSMFIGNLQIWEDEDSSSLFILTVYFVVAEGSYFFVTREKEKALQYIAQAGFFVSLLTYVMYACQTEFGDNLFYYWMARVVLVFGIAMAVGFLVYQSTAEKNSFTTGIDALVLIGYLAYVFVFLLPTVEVGIAFCIGTMVWIEIRQKRDLDVVQWFAMAFLALPLLFANHELSDWICECSRFSSVGLAAVALLGYGIVRKRKPHIFMGYILGVIHILDITTQPFGYFCNGVIVLGLIGVSLWKTENRKNSTCEWMYLVSVFFLIKNMYSLAVDGFGVTKTNEIWILPAMVVCIYNCWMYKMDYIGKNIPTWLNGVVMSVAIWGVANVEQGQYFVHFLYILLACAAFSLRVKPFLESEKKWVSAYVGVKYTVLVINIVQSFQMPTMVVSIACFLTAIVFIVTGFRLGYSMLRICGLVVSILSAVKLILWDFSYTSVLERAAGFIFCGMLCFVISAIYNHLNKNIEE